MKILHKYVLKEHLGPLTFALSALTSIMLLNYIAKNFGELVGKGLPWTAIAEFFLLSIPFTVALTMPMAVLVASLYAFSRLAAENEITALKASGIGLPRVLAPVMIAGLGVTVLMLLFNDQLLPRTNHMLAQLRNDIAQKKPTFALREQVINTLPGDKLYLRTNHLDERSNLMREVTIYDMSDATVRRTIYADSGTLAFAPNRKDLLMTLYSGVIQDVPTAEPERLQRVYFHDNIIRVSNVANSFTKSGEDNSKSDREMSVCEMQKEVDKHETELVSAQTQFVSTVELAHKNKVTIPAASLKEDTRAPSPYSLGRAYCRVLQRIGVRGLGVDGPPNKDSLAAAQAMARMQVQIQRAQEMQIARFQAEQAKRMQEAQKKAGKSGTMTPGMTAAKGLAAGGTVNGKPGQAKGLPTAGIVNGKPGQLHAPGAVLRPGMTRPVPMPGQRVPPGLGYPTPLRGYPQPVVGQLHTLPPPSMSPIVIEGARLRMTEARSGIADYEVEIHKKFALAVCCFIFVMLGAPIALRFPRGGVGLTIGVSLFVFALYYVGLIAGESLAKHGLMPAALSMWSANIVFGLVALLLLWRMGKEGNTARGGDAGEVMDTMRRWIRRRLGRERRTESIT